MENNKESPEVNHYIYSQLIYDKPRIRIRESTVSSINSVGKTGKPYAKNEPGPLSYTIYKN